MSERAENLLISAMFLFAFCFVIDSCSSMWETGFTKGEEIRSAKIRCEEQGD